MKPNFKAIVFLILVTVVFYSCRIEKRLYNKGYYVTSNFHKKNKEIVKSKELSTATEIPDNSEVFASLNSSNEFSKTFEILKPSVETYNKDLLLSEKVRDLKRKINSDKCDVITMKNGVDKSVKVTEVSDTEIKYKNCDNIEGPTYVVKVSDIFRINFQNGTTQIFGNQQESKNEDYSKSKISQPSTQTTNVFAIIGLIAGILAMFTFLLFPILGMLFGALGFIFGLVALNQIKKNPTTYKGKGLAIAAAICGGIGFLLAFIWFVLLILLLL
jgi:hypothetical protein